MALAYDQTPTKRAQDADLTPDQKQVQREDKLVRLLKSYEEDALGYAQSEIVQQQLDSLKRYFGELYGDEEEGRSQVTTREVLEGIEWTRPDLMRVFASGGNVVTVTEAQPEDARYAKDAADYLAWMFFTDNPGFELLDDFAFDGLLHRRGYIACYWRDKEYQAPQQLTGLSMEQVMQLMQDPQVEIIGQDVEEDSEVQGVSLVIRRLKSPARAEIQTIAPEDMRLNGRAVSIDQARYVGRVIRMLRGEACREWPEREDEIWSYKTADAGTTGAVRRSEDVRQERFQDDRNDVWRSQAQGDDASTEIEVLEEYLRVDLNGDGYPEMIRSYRIGDLILEESEVEENPFGSWTPIRVPHRFMGMGYYELVQDLQRQSTVITRAGLDALYQNVVQREAYDKNKVDLEPLMATYSGAKVGVDGPPGEAIIPLHSDTSTSETAWRALEILKQRLEDRTGASRQTRGLDSDQLTGEHSGKALNMLQINADARKEMVARNMALGLGAFFSKLYRLVCRNQNEARQAKVGGKWCQFDPRTWNSMLTASLHSGGINREHTLMGLQLIGAEQAQVIETLGPGNPIVTAKNRYAYQEELCRIAGFRSAESFFTEVPDVPETDAQGQPVVDQQTGQPKMKPWQPPDKPDPQMAKVQADAQAQQAKMALDTKAAVAAHELAAKTAATDAALKQQADQEALQQAKEKAALELQTMRDKAAADIQTARDKATAELQLAYAQMDGEMQLARERMHMEMELEREKLAHQREMHTEKTDAAVGMNSEKVAADVKISKNREGGDLDK